MANGVASTLDLVPVPGAPDRLMRREAARQMGALRAAFAAHFGVPLYLAETFRSLKTQQDYYRTYPRGSAAVPGTSFHGTGDAADIWTGVDKYGTPQHQWMQANAPAYGFTNTQGKATRSSRYPNGEAHHWVYVGRPTIVAGLDSATIDNDGNDMADITQGQVQWIANTLLDTGIKTAVGDRTVKQVLSDALLFGQANANEIAAVKAGLAGTPGAVWAVRLEHTVAKDAQGKPLSIPAGDLLRYEPAEHEGTRRAVAAVGRADVDLDYAAVVAELKASGLDPATFATYAADEADRRERDRLGS
jgi:hypothetical protein